MVMAHALDKTRGFRPAPPLQGAVRIGDLRRSGLGQRWHHLNIVKGGFAVQAAQALVER